MYQILSTATENSHPNFTPFSSVSVVDFEQVNVNWVIILAWFLLANFDCFGKSLFEPRVGTIPKT